MAGGSAKLPMTCADLAAACLREFTRTIGTLVTCPASACSLEALGLAAQANPCPQTCNVQGHAATIYAWLLLKLHILNEKCVCIHFAMLSAVYRE
jgi:hypothetical protein